MKLTLACAALFALTSVAAADVSVVDNDQTVDVDCAKDKMVTLVGNHITATLRGTCSKLTITGNHATVTGSVLAASISGNENTTAFASIDVVVVSGNQNTVTYKGPATAKAVKVSNPGNKNTISKLK